MSDFDFAANDPLSGITDAMASHGIFVTEPVREGFHRYQHREDRKGKRNVWVKLHTDGTPNGEFGDFKRLGPGSKIKWTGKSTVSLTPGERAEIKRQLREDARKRAAADRAKHDAAAARAKEIWDGAAPCEDHPYLAKKGVRSHGLRVADEWVKEYVDRNTGQVTVKRIKHALIIPLRNSKRQTRLLQAIFPSENGTGNGIIDWNLANLPVYLADFVGKGNTLTLTYW